MTTTNIPAAIVHLFPSAKSLVDFVVRDDGNGQYIAEWNLPDPQPTDAELAAASAEAERLASVPQSVSMRQARLALLQVGLLSNVAAVINAMPSPQKEAAQIEWEYSGEVWRNKALVKSLGPALGLTEAQVDSLFITAATL